MAQNLVISMLFGTALLFLVLLILLIISALKPRAADSLNHARTKADLQKIKRQIEKSDDE